MKSILIYIFLALLFSRGVVPAAESDSTAILYVPYNQDSLLVILDETPLGKTPLHAIVSTGAHELIVQSLYWPSWDQQDFRYSFVALPGQEYQIEPEFIKRISINSIPFGATVYNNGKVIGTTPLNLNIENELEITIEYEGYMPQPLSIDISNQAAYLVQLVPAEEWLFARKQKELDKRKNIGLKRKLLIASLGLSAAAGFSTAHFRSRGNKEFDKYQSTAIPSTMNEHFSNAQYYDRLGNASYALFEMGFILSGYFFLTSRE
jgi:hypothetical protein